MRSRFPGVKNEQGRRLEDWFRGMEDQRQGLEDLFHVAKDCYYEIKSWIPEVCVNPLVSPPVGSQVMGDVHAARV